MKDTEDYGKSKDLRRLYKEGYSSRGYRGQRS